MPISFACARCGRSVTAPDAAAGKRGKCPFCGHSNEIPQPDPPQEEDLIPLAPVDENEELETRRRFHELYEQEKELLSETGGPAAIPLIERDDLTSEDLHHFVVNYCLDMAAGKLGRAGTYIVELREFGPLGVQAVEDFLSGSATEPALDRIPRPVLHEFFRQLKSQVK
jgi:hypothetical protein